MIRAGLPEAKSSMERKRVMTIRATILSFVLLFPLPLFAQGSNDIIVMKNGDKFTCEIKGLSTGVLSSQAELRGWHNRGAVVTDRPSGE
jgi:hypothetical protein